MYCERLIVFSMGLESVVYGMIRGRAYHVDRRNALHELNEIALNKLPTKDEWPFLTRGMFSFVPHDSAPFGIYKSQIIHFGASFKSLEDEWPAWITKFEALLKTLYFDTATLHLNSEGSAHNRQYSWKAKVEEGFYTNFPPKLPLEWSFMDDPDFPIR